MSGERVHLAPADRETVQRHVRWFHELDEWTEYWDIYHLETRGRYYFGDGQGESGLLTRFIPREQSPAPWRAWKRLALGWGTRAEFEETLRVPEVREALLEIDALVGEIYNRSFGDPADPAVQRDYLEGTFRFAIDSLPPATARDALIDDRDLRKLTAGRHRIWGDPMWFMWALQLEGAQALAGNDAGADRRALLLAGVAMGTAADFAWRGHRRTRREYIPGPAAAELLLRRGRCWATDLAAAAEEIHTLYQIREWGEPPATATR